RRGCRRRVAGVRRDAVGVSGPVALVDRLARLEFEEPGSPPHDVGVKPLWAARDAEATPAIERVGPEDLDAPVVQPPYASEGAAMVAAEAGRARQHVV